MIRTNRKHVLLLLKLNQKTRYFWYFYFFVVDLHWLISFGAIRNIVRVKVKSIHFLDVPLYIKKNSRLKNESIKNSLSLAFNQICIDERIHISICLPILVHSVSEPILFHKEAFAVASLHEGNSLNKLN